MSPKTLLGHPRGLFVLFFTEMWERFSYYGMRALLVLYMTQHLIAVARSGQPVFGFSGVQTGLEWLFGPLSMQALASQLYGLYTGLVYFTPLFGGLLADRYWGQRRTVMTGGALMATGHFLLIFESLFLPALVCLILGSGCFKPNISTQVGSLYPLGDPRRDGAFTLFYMGINLGALLAPLICGTLGQLYGWHAGFAAAGVGMLIGLVIYRCGYRYLPTDRLERPAIALSAPLTGAEWRAITGLMILAMLNIVFWAVYEQQGNTLQLFADRQTDWRIGGWDVPSTWFQALNPAFIILLAPLLARLPGRQGGSVDKMAFGAALLGLSFLVLTAAVADLQAQQKISVLWLALCTLIYTIGELYLSPVGLSLVTQIAPRRRVGLLMGAWFLSVFFGNLLAGYIGSFYETLPQRQFFMLLAGLGGATALAMFALRKPLTRALI